MTESKLSPEEAREARRRGINLPGALTVALIAV